MSSKLKWLSGLFVVAVFFFGLNVHAAKEVAAAKSAKTMTKGGTQGDFGAGGQLGVLSGGTAEYFLSDYFSLQGVVGYDFSDSGLGVSGDALYHFVDALKPSVSKGDLAFYAGLGVKQTFGNGNHDNTKVRVPLGADYFFEGANKWQAYGELVPEWKVTNNSGFDFEGAVGARYFFN